MAEPDNNPHALAGASEAGIPVQQVPVEPREVFPVMFDKDYLDFRPEEVSEEELAPKGRSAQELVSEQRFSEDLIPSPENESASLEVPGPTTESPTSVPPSAETVI